MFGSFRMSPRSPPKLTALFRQHRPRLALPLQFLFRLSFCRLFLRPPVGISSLRSCWRRLSSSKRFRSPEPVRVIFSRVDMLSLPMRASLLCLAFSLGNLRLQLGNTRVSRGACAVPCHHLPLRIQPSRSRMPP